MPRIAVTMILMTALALSLESQTPSNNPARARPATQVQSDLLQLMRGILYPASNVVFSAQNDDPAAAKPVPGQDPSLATDPLRSTFGGWRAVDSAALALAESANLLNIAGRKCSNGVPVPLEDPDWAKFVQELRDAGMKAYKLAQSRNQDTMVEAADTLTEACAHCHRKWREKPLANRCK